MELSQHENEIGVFSSSHKPKANSFGTWSAAATVGFTSNLWASFTAYWYQTTQLPCQSHLSERLRWSSATFSSEYALRLSSKETKCGCIVGDVDTCNNCFIYLVVVNMGMLPKRPMRGCFWFEKNTAIKYVYVTFQINRLRISIGIHWLRLLAWFDKALVTSFSPGSFIATSLRWTLFIAIHFGCHRMKCWAIWHPVLPVCIIYCKVN